MSLAAYALALASMSARAGAALVPALLAQVRGEWLSLTRWREELTLSLEAIRIERLHAEHDEIVLRYRDNASAVGAAQARMESVVEQRCRRVSEFLADWPAETQSTEARVRVNRLD